MMPWKRKKLIKQIKSAYGKVPVKEYYPGDLDCIRTYFDTCRQDNGNSFYVDETTWKDLDMDELYKRINACQCTAGEQYLYYMLRRPMHQETFETQKGLIRLADEEPDLRLKIQLLLNRIGNTRAVDLTSVFHPKNTSPFWLIIYILMGVLLLASILVTMILGKNYILVPILLAVLNSIFHELRRSRCEHDINRVNYCVSLALSLRRIQKWKLQQLDRYLEDAYGHLNHMKPILRSGPVLSRFNSDVLQQAMLYFFLTDLIAFEILKKRLEKYRKHFLAVHEAIGRVDAAIAVASYRAGLDIWCEPEIDYASALPYVHAEGVTHPLLKNPVANDFVPEKSMLITGSNASGKSTYLRSAVLCALMAQTLCTCTCICYKASFFRLYTSMALSDDLLAGESYYIAEIKSLKRILDAQKADGFILCAIDEVLRGTNTVERIAASVEILKALDHPGTLCLIATHDSELCTLAGDAYQMMHFEETVSDTEIRFDYKLKDGPAETRNAIHLLKLMGFDDIIVDAAHKRADNYTKTGKWI